jgi:hypothetical protein
MKKSIPLFTLLFATLIFKSQVTLLSENFNSGFPSWTQNPTGSWTLQPSLGYSASPCIITEEAGSTSTGTATIKTFTINLTGVINPTINFKAAITKNNFLPGDLVLYCDQGTGPQFVARWGSGFSPNTTDTIPEGGFDPVPPLDSNNVYWYSYSHTISPTSNTISIMLAAELFNGGYILLDDISVKATPVNTTGGMDSKVKDAISIFPNPVPDGKIRIKGEHIKSATVFNQLGEAIKTNLTQVNETSLILDTSTLKSGVYHLEILTENNTIIPKKIVVE